MNQPKEEALFESTHKLDFMACPWPVNPEFIAFKIGTCEGIYESTDKTYDIIAVVNDTPGNGHFEDVLEWFYNSCRRDKKSLRFMEIMNDKFGKHLLKKRRFKKEGENNLIKKIEHAKMHLHSI